MKKKELIESMKFTKGSPAKYTEYGQTGFKKKQEAAGDALA